MGGELKRPMVGGSMAMVTTPRVATMMALLGAGIVRGPIALSRDEFTAVNRLYGFKKKKPNKKPPPPEAPKHEDFVDKPWEYRNAMEAHKRAAEAHANWKDPIDLLQAGADRNAMRHAEADGLRLLAWISKFTPEGSDPLKTLIQFAMEAGVDVDPSDCEWANDD